MSGEQFIVISLHTLTLTHTHVGWLFYPLFLLNCLSCLFIYEKRNGIECNVIVLLVRRVGFMYYRSVGGAVNVDVHCLTAMEHIPLHNVPIVVIMLGNQEYNIRIYLSFALHTVEFTQFSAELCKI